MDQAFDGKVLNYQRVDEHWKTAKTNMFVVMFCYAGCLGLPWMMIALENLNVADC